MYHAIPARQLTEAHFLIGLGRKGEGDGEIGLL